MRSLFSICLLFAVSLPAAPNPKVRYALILEEPALVEQTPNWKAADHAAATAARLRVAESQNRVRAALAASNIRVTTSVQTLVNAIFVRAERNQLATLQQIPGVRKVVELKPIKRKIAAAHPLMNVPQAWDINGGELNSGLGVKIAVIDTGVDHEHPGMQDPSLPPAPGGARCTGTDCAFTNNKVVAARSYVDLLDLPDDFTPRDRVGHGTAVAMIAAGVRNTGPAGTIVGVAPRAYIGNYKVFGSAGVNDFTYGDVLTRALDDAFQDGMDIVTYALGAPADWAPADVGCGMDRDLPCDPIAYATYNAVNNGMTVVAAAGNEGESGLVLPTLATISSPGTVENAITVGAITNSRSLYSSVQAEGLARMNAVLGDGVRPAEPLTAPLRSVASLDPDNRGCVPLPNNSLNGAIALIQTGFCPFSVKTNIAQAAGAIGVILFRSEGDTPFPPTGLLGTAIPVALIGHADGVALQDSLSSVPDRPVTIDPALVPSSREPNIVAGFSSLGPSIDNQSIKPEIVAVGTDVYTATQRLDPSGDMYDPSGYIAMQGTSFSVPFVAGAVALVKQRNPEWNSAQLKSAVVNTASSDVRDTDFPDQIARVTAMGAGKLDVERALRTNLTVEPSVLSFGAISANQSTLPSKTLRFYNSSDQPVSIEIRVVPRDSDPNAQVTVSRGSLTLPPGSTSEAITVALEGSRPQPGNYEGYLEVTGGAVPLRIPYLYVVGDGIPYNIIPLRNYDFTWVINTLFPSPLSLKVIDRYGVPVANARVLWRRLSGGTIVQVSSQAGANVSLTDEYGISEAYVALGSQPGEYAFQAEVSGLDSAIFLGVAKFPPIILDSGVTNAASGQADRLAPGSYASIFGVALSDTFAVFQTPYLPFSLAGVSVSFESERVSAPGRLHFVSDGQINVQIPWELQGESSAKMWVTVSGISSEAYDVPLSNSAPGGFQYQEPGTNRIYAAALDTQYRLIGTDNPARRGEVVLLFANGAGPVDNQPPTGEPSPSEPFATVKNPIEVTIGGRPANVAFAGLAPGLVGVHQINVVVPEDTLTGIQPVVITSEGISSRPFNLPVQ